MINYDADCSIVALPHVCCYLPGEHHAQHGAPHGLGPRYARCWAPGAAAVRYIRREPRPGYAKLFPGTGMDWWLSMVKLQWLVDVGG